MAAIARYTTTLDRPIEIFWLLIRDFNNCPAYIERVTDSEVENGKRSDEVGGTDSLRRTLDESRIRCGTGGSALV